MAEHEAVFEVESKSDARAVEKLMERAHNMVREEVRTSAQGSDDTSEVLAAFEALREAAEDRSPGTLRISLEQRDEGFGD